MLVHTARTKLRVCGGNGRVLAVYERPYDENIPNEIM